MNPFDYLSPDLVLNSVEQSFNLILDPQIIPFPSYINRVYGIKTDEGQDLVVKFYRPGRWSPEALEEEQNFIFDCQEAELPVIAPLPDPEGYTLGEVELGIPSGETLVYNFSVFEKKAGRVFDAEGDGDWLRLGRLLGRLHEVGRREKFNHRIKNSPGLTEKQVLKLLPLVHPDVKSEWEDIIFTSLELVKASFEGRSFHRIHGDCHRGNILNRDPQGLLLMDFDDCQMGPPVQDLWLLLPGAREECHRETVLLSEGYREFSDSGKLNWDLVEPLRFMRMVHFLTWCSSQKEDKGFDHHFPGWGTRSFWIRETEDFRDQLGRLIPD